MSEKCIGIDLGTGNSCVAVVEGGEPTIIVNATGGRTTPSIVLFDENERLVGDPAKRKMITAPGKAVSFIKRFMGAQYKDDVVQKMLSQITYKVNNKGGKPVVNINDADYTPEQISAMILAEMKKIASDYCGEEIKKAVITVPAWFNNTQREATKAAGEIAGLEVLRIINEPTAAILSSSINLEEGEEKTVAVFDFGCGTTDISVCELAKVDGQLMVEVKASYGDVYLGGQNYDHAIIDWIIDEFKKAHDGHDLSKDLEAMQRINKAAEDAKIALSGCTTTNINLPYITSINGKAEHIDMDLTRAKFEQLTENITSKAIDCTKTAIEKSGKAYNEIDYILLVGGSTRIPMVQTALTKEFGIELCKSANPDEAVAKGAAIQANILGGNHTSTNILLLDVTPLTVGIETEGGLLTPMIEANTTIPTSKTETFTTAADNQPVVSIRVFQGQRAMTKDCKLLGEFNLGGIMPAPRGVPQIEVTFDIDANGILKVSALDKATGKANNITITGGSGNSISKEEIERMKADAEKYKAEDEKMRAEIDELNSAESYAYMIKTTVEDKDLADKISDEDKKSANEKADALLESVKAKNIDQVKTLREDLEACYKSISDKIYARQAAAEQATTGQSATEESATTENASSNDENIQDADFEEVK